MLRAIAIIALMLNFMSAQASQKSCDNANGMWIGKFSYKDLSRCELKYPELCKNVNIAITIKSSNIQDSYIADLFPQRGIGGTINLQCRDGQLEPTSDAPLPPGTKFKYHCDEFDTCIVSYEDFRLKAKLIKMWQADARIN